MRLFASAFLSCALVALLGCGAAAPAPTQASAPGSIPGETAKPKTTRADIRLVVWVTIDQLGSNVLERQARHLPGSAWGALVERGLWFSEAAYAHSITETAPGHATLFTGAPPAVHGIVANEWFDRSTKKLTTSVTDENAPLLGPLGLLTEAPGTGRSPRLLRAPTLGDALIQASSRRSRVVSVSVKDRAAILSAGFAGTAYWLGSTSYVTSRYYRDTPTAWFSEHDKQKPLSSYLEDAWPLSLGAQDYSARPAPAPYAPVAVGAIFPHCTRPGERLREAIKFSPLGDRATLDLAQAALVGEELGADSDVDLLAVSLSALDYAGHYFGPESLEAEDTFVRANQGLARFLNFVDEHVGREHVLVVLSADHGGAETRETLGALGLPGQRLSVSGLRAALDAALSERFGSRELVSAIVPPYVFLDHEAIRARSKTVSEVSEVAREALQRLPGVHSAVALPAQASSGELGERIAASYFAGRSGDLYIVPVPYSLLLQEDDLGATHGSPWSYDSRVPIVLVGPGLPRGQVTRPVSVEALAPTVARLLGVTPPAGATRSLLFEALQP